MLLCNQKKICIKRKIEQRWGKGYPFSLSLKTNFRWNCFPKVPLEIILKHVQREKFTFTIAHSISNISLDLKCKKRRARVLKIQFYVIFHLRAAQLWYKIMTFTWVFKDMKIRLTRSFVTCYSISSVNYCSCFTLQRPPPHTHTQTVWKKLLLHSFGKITPL